jgi:hypothetical protein
MANNINMQNKFLVAKEVRQCALGPQGSHCVPNLFFSMFPNSSSLYFIFFALSSTLQNLSMCNPKEESITYLF